MIHHDTHSGSPMALLNESKPSFDVHSSSWTLFVPRSPSRPEGWDPPGTGDGRHTGRATLRRLQAQDGATQEAAPDENQWNWKRSWFQPRKIFPVLVTRGLNRKQDHLEVE